MLYKNAVLTILLAAQAGAMAENILTNSGFEYGLMCYTPNVWTDTGVFGKGDYKLSLSTDAHSGAYSLQIACSGADCPKAAAYSNKIPTLPNQGYSLTFWSKCPAGGEAAVYIPGTASGDLFQRANCTGAWAQNSMQFKTSATASDFFFYLFNYDPGWVRYDDVVLTYADGTVPSKLEHSGSRNVSVSPQAVMVDGAPYFALGFFDVDYADLPAAAATGANTLFGLGLENNAACFNTNQKNFLDRAYELGLNFVPESSPASQLAVAAVFPGLMRQYAPHLANIAWMMADEPDQKLVPFWYTQPEDFNANVDAAKTQTALPLFADMQRAAWSTASEVAPYAPKLDFLMAEPYGPDFQSIVHATEMFHNFSPERPIWLAQDNPGASLIVPKAYWAVVNGATGIGYFNWPAFRDDPAQLAAAKQVFSELKQLQNVIFGRKIDGIVSASAGIGKIYRYSDGSAYILAVNPGTSPVSAEFRVSGLAEGRQIKVLFEDRFITAKAGSFTDEFPAQSRHVYSIALPAAAVKTKVQ